MHLKILAFASLLVSCAAFAAEPAAVTTYAESHPNAEYHHIYAANADCHTNDSIPIKKGNVIFFKVVPAENDKTLDARLEDGSVHPVTVADFYKVSDVGAAAPPAQPAAAK
jgi:hypothetical protein